MEYIHGQPVDIFCRENLRDYRSRCELFLRILEAVAYAHRGLVVHRDLKPANILVTPDGTPKLLDFGVAKLLSGDPQEIGTRTAVHRPFTPAYASPEQVRGLPITTATDIYSLGAILFELLIGSRAQPIAVPTPEEIERVVCRSQIKRGALHAHGLDWDLDNIVAMATRKEPERRYHSAQEFAEDIRRHLEGKPVVAGPDSLAYRGAKFVRRNAWRLAASFLVASSLVVGLAVSIAQSHRARVAEARADAARVDAIGQTALAKDAAAAEFRQRTFANQQSVLANEQRDRAERLRAIADQRTASILDLANRTLFDIHDSIAALPGSMDARRTLVKTTLDYLENLEQQQGLDDKMRATLAAAYFKVAMMQGNPHGASLQEFDLAEKTLLKGQLVLMPAYSRAPEDRALMMRYIEIRYSLADLIFRSGRTKEAVQVNRDLLPIAHKLFEAQTCSRECRTQEPEIEEQLTYELLTSDAVEALVHANRAIALTRELQKTHPDDETLKQELGSIMAAAAGGYRTLGDLPRAAEYYRESIAIREDLLHGDPHNVVIRRNVMIAYGNYATVLGIPWSPNLGRSDEARIYARKGVELARETVKGDVNDATGRHDLGMTLGRLGMIEPGADMDEVAQSLAALEEAESFIRPILVANPKSSETAAQLALILEYEGFRLQTLGRAANALERFGSSVAALQPFTEEPHMAVNTLSQYLSSREDLALLDVSIGDMSGALREANLSVSQAKSICDRPHRSDAQTIVIAKAWATLAFVESKAGKAAEARDCAGTALELWKTVTTPGILVVHQDIMARTQALLSAPVVH